MSKSIYRNSKQKKFTHVDAKKRYSRILNSKVANDIKQKDTTLGYRFTDKNFDKGMLWFDSGLSLEEAPEELKKDGSFIKGFNRGKTIKLVNDTLYAYGEEFYLRGVELEDTPEKYRDNEYFIAGYNDAVNNYRKK